MESSAHGRHAFGTEVAWRKGLCNLLAGGSREDERVPVLLSILACFCTWGTLNSYTFAIRGLKYNYTLGGAEERLRRMVYSELMFLVLFSFPLLTLQCFVR